MVRQVKLIGFFTVFRFWRLFKVTLYDENTDFIIFYIFVDLYSEAGDLSIAASFFPKY
jgi:hypothetical protein